MLNKIQLIGRAGGNPETRQTTDGRNIANLTLATTDKWKDKSGQQQERTEWHRVVFFGGLADVVGKYVKKGSMLYVDGKLQTRKYTNKDGVEVYTTEVIVDQRGNMQMLGSKVQSDTQDSLEAQAPANSDVEFDDEIPFN